MLNSIPRTLILLLSVALTTYTPTRAAKLELPPQAPAILDKIYSGDLFGAITASRTLQQAQPSHPLGYLLEGEALWWEIWCTSAEFKYGMSYPRHRSKLPADQHYLDLAARVIALADAQIAAHANTSTRADADMHFYAGMGEALLARLYSLRGETRNSARAGVRARERLLRAVGLDPTLADTDLGLGLYNYYADTLSSAARVLRFFMGIPGGNKQDGIRQLQHAIADGVLTPPEARFYLAINLHNYDQKYEQALEISAPLSEKYPSNPIFQLIRGDLYAKLGRRDLALDCYKAASALTLSDPDSNAHIHELLRLSTSALQPPPFAN